MKRIRSWNQFFKSELAYRREDPAAFWAACAVMIGCLPLTVFWGLAGGRR